MEIKKNLSLIAGISIPVLMIIIVAGIIFLPVFFIHPQGEFLYSVGSFYYGIGINYSIKNGKVVRTEKKQEKYGVDAGYYHYDEIEPKLYLHDIATNTSRDISYEEVQKLTFDSNPKSPDGFEVVYGGINDGLFPLLFGGGREYNKRYLKGSGYAKKLELQLNDSDYSREFQFLGWLK